MVKILLSEIVEKIILENDDIRLNCAKQCIEFSKRYSWSRTADEFINLFNQTKQ